MKRKSNVMRICMKKVWDQIQVRYKEIAVFSLSAVLALGWATPALAVQFSLYGVLGKSDAVQTGAAGATGSFAPGGGIGLEFPLGSMTGLEIDGFYLQRKNLDTFTYIEVPVLYRVHLGQYVSLGAGAYFADGQGSNFASNGISSTDLGLVGGLGVLIPLGGMNLGLEGRYEYGGLWDNSTYSGITTSFNSLQILLSIKFGGGSGSGH